MEEEPADGVDGGGNVDETPASVGVMGGFRSTGPANAPILGGSLDDKPASVAIGGGFHLGKPAKPVLAPAIPEERPRSMALPYPFLIARCREELHFNQQQLADFLASSLRTVQRWEAGRSTPMTRDLTKLADAVRPHDPALAAEIDVYAPRSPAPVVAEAPSPEPPPPQPPPAPAVPVGVLVDSVVCAAAEALAQSPQVARPGVLAAFARAREAGLTLDAVLAVLAPPPPEEAATSKAKRGKGGGG